MARVIGINHVALEVRSVDEALTWYGSFLDFELRGRRATMAWIDLGDQFIALSQGVGPIADGDRHLGLVVDDKEAVRSALRARGVDVAAAGNLRFRDPWGNQIEVVDYRQVQFSKTAAVLAGMGLADLAKDEAALSELRGKGLAERSG